MTDGVNIDFGALQHPNYVGDYVNAFKVGQDMGRQSAPPSVANAMTGPPPPAAPDPAALVAAMSPGARPAAGERAELLSGVGQGLKGVPYARRGAVLAHMGPALAARGVPAQAIAEFDPTDANLDAAVESLKSLGEMLAGARG